MRVKRKPVARNSYRHSRVIVNEVWSLVDVRSGILYASQSINLKGGSFWSNPEARNEPSPEELSTCGSMPYFWILALLHSVCARNKRQKALPRFVMVAVVVLQTKEWEISVVLLKCRGSSGNRWLANLWLQCPTQARAEGQTRLDSQRGPSSKLLTSF